MAQVKLLKIANNLPTEHDGTADDLTVLSLSSDTISERTATAGVTADGVLLKDGGINLAASASLSVNGTGILVDSGGSMTLSNVDAIDATTEATFESAIDSLTNLVAVGALDAGSITANFGAIDNGTSNITTGGILKIDVDGTAENAAGSLTLGAGNDAGIFFDGTDLVVITNGVGASGIKLDSEDDTVEILGSGVLQATFDTGGLNLVSGDEYSINGASVLSATTLGSSVVTSSLTTVGTIGTGTWQATDIGVDYGGTGRSSATAYAVVCGGTTATGAHQSVASVGSSGEVLTSNGAGALPTFQPVSATLTVDYTNGNAGAIAKGDVVYLESAVNDTVELADADTIAHGEQLVGIVQDASISAAASGAITVVPGQVVTGILSSATAGDIYYLSATGTTGNTLTNTAPSGGPALVRIGIAKNATDLIYSPMFIADTTA